MDDSEVHTDIAGSGSGADHATDSAGFILSRVLWVFGVKRGSGASEADSGEWQSELAFSRDFP